MASYQSFAQFYDSLTLNVDYKSRADYILKLFDRLNHNMGITLDLACGTGSLTLELAQRGVDIYGIDASQDMLSEALDKAYDLGLNILFLCQKMQNIDLYGTVDTCICTLDSINHLTDIKDVQKTFDRVSLFLDPDGYFLFDVNTPYKHSEILQNNTFVYETDDVFCVWQNELLDDLVVDINIDFFVKNEHSVDQYTRYYENFREKAYTHSEICTMLTNSGLELVAYYGDMNFNSPQCDEQRVIYVAKKSNSTYNQS